MFDVTGRALISQCPPSCLLGYVPILLCSPSVACQFFRRNAFSDILYDWLDCNSTTNLEVADQHYILRVHYSHKVFDNAVTAIFVKLPVLSEREQIELEALALYHLLIGNIEDMQFCKVGLASFRAQRCELRASKRHEIARIWVDILESFKDVFARFVIKILCSLTSEVLQVVRIASFCLFHTFLL